MKMKLKFVYNNKDCFNAPLDIIEGVGMVSVWEEPQIEAFVLMPKKLVPGRGEVVDPKRSLQVLKKSDGWEGCYELEEGEY
jgi:hypothetical protein